MLKIFLIPFLFLSLSSQALKLDERRNKIIGIVQEELKEALRLAKHQNYQNPDTLFRISELQLEKARIVREKENERYLSIPPEDRAKMDKEKFFKSSRKLFEKANESALNLVKRHPSYRDIGDVYYIMAYNYRELSSNSLAQKYFKLSISSSKDAKISQKSKIALADYYYNEKKYSEAVPLYESSLKLKSDKWWTRDAINLSWCYFHEKKYNLAINLMKEVYVKSSEGFIDLRSQVERDIGIFFVEANLIEEGLKFYQQHKLDFIQPFLKISSQMISQGRFNDANRLLKKIKEMSADNSRKHEIMLFELVLFDKFDRTEDHLRIAKDLVESHNGKSFSKEDFEKLYFQITKKAAELQKAVASNLYKDVPQVKRKKAKEATEYFELASKIRPEKKAEFYFFRAETFYSMQDFENAIQSYLTAFDFAEKSNDKKTSEQALEGMLASLGRNEFSKQTALKYYIPVYTRYIEFDSKSQKASLIFTKLFNSQFDIGDINSAENTLRLFSQNFPSDYKNQEGMLARIMEFYRKKNDYKTVKAYVSKISNGEFVVSKKYALALQGVLTKIQIEGAQKNLKSGNKIDALKAYLEIYKSTDATLDAKTNAAYNLSALYYELADPDECYAWLKTSLEKMAPKDVVQYSTSILNMAAALFLWQKFERSIDVTSLMLNKICKEDSSNKEIAFKNLVFISLANNDIQFALQKFREGKTCMISDAVYSDVSIEILKELVKFKKWQWFEDVLINVESNSRNYPRLISPLEDYRLELLSIGDSNLAQKIYQKQEKFFEISKSQKLEIPVEALDLMADRKIKGLKDKKQTTENIVLKFPEEDFNKSVKSILNILDEMTVEAESIQLIGSGRGIVEAFKILTTTYDEFGNRLKNFRPDGKEDEYIKSFQKAMRDIYLPILENSKKQKIEIQKLILENKILSNSNHELFFSGEDIFKRYFGENKAILMDRGGKR